MAYNKAQSRQAGKNFVNMIYELADGIDWGDAVAVEKFRKSLMASLDEIRGDTDAAILHIISGMSEEFGDRRMNKPV